MSGLFTYVEEYIGHALHNTLATCVEQLLPAVQKSGYVLLRQMQSVVSTAIAPLILQFLQSEMDADDANEEVPLGHL
jgi:hypothetical protein